MDYLRATRISKRIPLLLNLFIYRYYLLLRNNNKKIFLAIVSSQGKINKKNYPENCVACEKLSPQTVISNSITYTIVDLEIVD
jgi:hypothetical protein